MKEIQNITKQLDLEWLQLIQEAKNLGIEKEEIREFLSSQKEKEKLQ
nr:anti-repressor SinI family protein [uncultured Bacillus sp.]